MRALPGVRHTHSSSVTLGGMGGWGELPREKQKVLAGPEGGCPHREAGGG